MTVVFASNFYNHHQAPFAKEMDMLTEHKFFFIETEPIHKERVKMGYGREIKPSYVLQSYVSKEADRHCRKLLFDADVVVWGSCPFDMIKPRLRCNKLTFSYSERIFKQGFKGLPYWGRYLKWRIKLGNYQREKHYLLCASAYSAGDYARMRLFEGKTYKWGYFPEFVQQDLNVLFERKQGRKISLLWVARFIPWKHPELAIGVAERLMADGFDFELNIIGTGELENSIQTMIEHKSLGDFVHILGAKTPKEVRDYMEHTDIFLLTSDHNEGWGAVLNEAMNSGCAVIASDAIGSVPFLMRNGENGLIYRSEDLDSLYSRVLKLMRNPDLRRELGKKAYLTISETWNARIAAENFIKLVGILSEKDCVQTIADGPCSIADKKL